jgi:hypothetical protein
MCCSSMGQMSLANMLAVSPCAQSSVLLGNPQEGRHPAGRAVSALQHVLAGLMKYVRAGPYYDRRMLRQFSRCSTRCHTTHG